LDGRVGAERPRALQPVLAARGRDDAAGAEQLRRLHADLADYAAGAEDQHALARLQAAAPLERQPGGEPRYAEADGERRVESVGHRVAAAGRNLRALAERAVRLDARVEVDEAAVGASADALLAGDVRRLVALVRERAAGDPDVDRVQAGRQHVEHLGARRVVELADLGHRAVLAEDRCTHRADTTIRRPMDDAAIAYDEQGLVPCVIQDWRTGEVLTLAYMNAESLAATRRTGELHLWSRSRDELWRKGATSGNTQAVRAIRYDCDGDALLALVEPAGPACHTGERTCFHRGELEPPAPHEALPALERTIAARAESAPAGSYTARLLADPPLIGAKVREEAEEVARAAQEEGDERVAEEAADVLYHLAVLLRGRGLSLEEAEEVLSGRRR